jgi:methionine-rich copper-binding protein CopC
MNILVKLYIAAAVAIATPLAAFAHAHLVSSDPAVGATVAAASTLKISFSEGIEIGLSKFDVIGPNGQPVADTKASLDPANNKLVLLQVKAPLGAGTYTVHWHVVSVDTHRTEGTYAFTVKP